MYALVIFLVAFAVRLIHVWQLRGTPFFDTLLGDANGYDQWAQRLAAGDWIGSEVFYQAPGYPYFLGIVYAIFGRDLLIVRVIQAAIGSFSCVLLGLAAARLFSRRVGLVAGLALAVWAPAIFFDSLLQKSVLDMFFMALALWLISGIRDQGSGVRGWFALGATMAALALTRENALLLIAVIAIWAFFKARRQLIPFAAGLAVVLTPVVVRNYAVDGGLYLTTSQFGSNFYIGNNPGADGTYASIRFGRGAPEFERLDAKEVAEESVGRTLSPSEVSSFWTGRALGYITSQPWSWVKLTGRKILLLFNRSEMLDTEAQESYAEFSTPLKILGWVTHFGILVPLAVIGMFASWPERRRLGIMYALTLAYAISVVMFFVMARYRYPLVPFLMIFAASGVTVSHVQNLFTTRQRVIAGLTVGVVAIFANIPVLSATQMRAITENNLGARLLELGRYDEAIAHHERAIALQPDYAPGYNNLGAALRAAGRLDDAIARYQQALELKPDFASASYNLANAQLEQGQAGASVDSFRRAIEVNPRSVEAHNNLGIALAKQGDAAGAMAAFRNAIAVDATSVNAHRNLGNMLIDAGQIAEGLSHLERAAALAPGEPDAVYDIGTVLLQGERFAAAASRFEAALTIRPDWAEAHNNLGIALASQGRIAQALPHFERAVEINPALADARANRDQARAALRK
jgi:tetratricopeptide (TPR) repeat protein/4-amino-4-deoxy-L-arabinose transferase-like glycosyltransferase